MPLREAISLPWDMALFGTHGSDLFFGRTTARVHVQHGIGAGKRVDGHNFTYGPRWALWRGQPKYEVMLEASHAVRDRAVAACPQLGPVITVVGDLAADRLLASLPARDTYRQALGIAPDETAILVTSTWGPYGLMARMGPRLLPALLRLSGKRRVMLTMHPHLWSGHHGDRRHWARRLSAYVHGGLLVCHPDETWVPYLAAADIAVTDHGSLGVYWSLLSRPTITIPAPTHLCAPGSRIAALHHSSLTLADPDVLDETITKALATFDPENHAGQRDAVVSYPGQAARRVRDALYQLLHLTPPAVPPHTTTASAPTPWLRPNRCDHDTSQRNDTWQGKVTA